MPSHPFTHGELLLHHRYEQGKPITCGAAHGCVTAVVDDVACTDCLTVLRAETQALYAAAALPEDPHGEAFDLFENVRPGGAA
jgi:hypothetical protein